MLVTGGAGFIGSYLCEGLLLKGFHVTAINNLSTSTRQNIRHLLKDKKNFSFVKNSILNLKALGPLICHCDIVYHLTAAVGVKYILDHPLESLLTNIDGTEMVFKLASRYKKRYF